MLYIAICDDEQEFLKELRGYVKDYLKENKEFAEIVEYNQSRMLLYDIEEGKHFDLILTDIEMPYIDGMSLASYIKQFLPEVLIVFITSHLKYAIDAYELTIFRYIPKKLLKDKFPNALRDAIHMINLQANQYYTIEMPSRVEKIPYKKILYIQRVGKNSVIALTNQTETKVRKSLAKVYQDLESEDFIYIDQGTIVNLAHIMSVKEGTVELKNGMCLLASHAKLEELKVRLCDFWGKQL